MILKRIGWLILFCNLIITSNVFSQVDQYPSVVISEISVGSRSASNYIELAVLKAENGSKTVDLSGWTIDNNQAYSKMNNGYIRMGKCFSSVPIGSVIIIYNDKSKFENINPKNKEELNKNKVYWIPISDSCLDKIGYSSKGESELKYYDWNTLLQLDASGDAVTLNDADGNLVNAINWKGSKYPDFKNSRTLNTNLKILKGTEDFLLLTDGTGCELVAIQKEKILQTPGTFSSFSFGFNMNIQCRQESPSSMGSDGVIAVTITGGTPSFTIEWEGASNGSMMSGAVIAGSPHLIENLLPGSYLITVTDAERCERTCATHLAETETETTCEGECTSIGPDNSDPNLCYFWEPENEFEDPKLPQQEVCPKESMTYTLTITDGEGEIIEIQEYEVNVSTINLEVTPNPATICSNNIITLDAGSGYNSYSWKNEAGAEINEQQTIDVTDAGKYTVDVTNQDGCSATEEVDVVGASDPEEIRQLLEDKGFSNIPITVRGEVLLQGGGSNYPESMITTTNTEFVDDCAKLLISFDADDVENEIAQVINNDLSVVIQDGFSAKGKIISYENICDGTGCDLDELFAVEEYEYSIQVYIYDEPQSEDDYLLIKFNQVTYETLAEKFISTPNPAPPVEIDEHDITYSIFREEDACIFEPLPSSPSNPQQNYAITKDPTTEKFHGYHFVNGAWVKGDPTEIKLNCDVQLNPDPSDLPCPPIPPGGGNDGTDDIYGDGDDNTVNMSGLSAIPNLEAYLHVRYPDIYTTFGAELVWSTSFNSFGNAIIQSGKEEYVNRFIEGHPTVGPSIASANTPQIWDCGTPFADEVRIETLLNNDSRIDRINRRIVDWLKDNNGNLDGLFTDKENFIILPEDPNNPFLSGPYTLAWHNMELTSAVNPVWPYQIYGTTQAIRIHITNINVTEVSPKTRFSARVILEVIDSYGAGHDDMGRFHLPGLVQLFVIQHYRNYDDSSPNCDSTPCYVPFRHSTFIPYSFTWFEH